MAHSTVMPPLQPATTTELRSYMGCAALIFRSFDAPFSLQTRQPCRPHSRKLPRANGSSCQPCEATRCQKPTLCGAIHPQGGFSGRTFLVVVLRTHRLHITQLEGEAASRHQFTDMHLSDDEAVFSVFKRGASCPSRFADDRLCGRAQMETSLLLQRMLSCYTVKLTAGSSRPLRVSKRHHFPGTVPNKYCLDIPARAASGFLQLTQFMRIPGTHRNASGKFDKFPG